MLDKKYDHLKVEEGKYFLRKFARSYVHRYVKRKRYVAQQREKRGDATTRDARYRKVRRI